MKLLAKYLTEVFLKNFLLVLVGLTSLLFFFDFIGQIFNKDYPTYQILIHSLLQVPSQVVEIIPPAVLMSTALTLTSLTRTNELTACYSIGIGLRQIMLIIVSIVFMISCFTAIMQDRILPALYKQRTTFYWREMKKKADFFLDVKQDKIWYRSKNLIYNLRSFDPKTQTIHGMAVYTFDQNFKLVQVLAAKTAKYLQTKWDLQDGTITVFSKDDYFPLSKQFVSKSLVIPETPKDFQEIEKEVDGLRFKELWRYIDRIKGSGVDARSHQVKLQYRFSLCFIPLVMCFLAVPFSTRSRREGGLAKDLGLGMAFTLLYWILYALGLALGNKGVVHPIIAAWTPSVFFAALAGGLLYLKRN